MTGWIVAYLVDWVVCGLWLWIEYLDVRTTMKVMQFSNGAEANPVMKPYVKKGQPWLMVRGKIKNGGWAGLLSFLIPFLAPFIAYKAYDTWTAVHGNEQLLTSGKLK